ncbi:MAG TPA: NAD(P)H-binding protein [Candidatus Acidoferrum sp.]|nr:NAD(P)H-binding protein [Candidatus Acidoferrum sp.]
MQLQRQPGQALTNDAAGEMLVITGAFSYTGKYATRILLDRGYRIRTLTYHPERENVFGDKVQVFSYNFDHPERLTETLRGASTLINTYWVRFPRGTATFEQAVGNTRTLIAAAKEAGVQRIIHVSIANPSLDSPLGYYKGKAQLEQAVAESGLAYTILRPTVIFGLEDILINNIAWFVRHFPVFAIPGDGRYRIRPIFVEDMARLIVDAIEGKGNSVRDAVGPETYTFEELIRLIAKELGRRTRVVHVPTPIAYLATRVTGWLVGDVVLTWEEYKGLMAGLLAPEGPSSGETRLSQWIAANREQIGKRYASEVARHYARLEPRAAKPASDSPA